MGVSVSGCGYVPHSQASYFPLGERAWNKASGCVCVLCVCCVCVCVRTCECVCVREREGV